MYGGKIENRIEQREKLNYNEVATETPTDPLRVWNAVSELMKWNEGAGTLLLPIDHDVNGHGQSLE